LGAGDFLVYVPKNSGGAKIKMGNVTAAVTGTTVMGEYTPGGLIKFIVLEGTVWMYLGNSLAIIHAGRALIFNENATRLPDPSEADLRLLLQSILITGFPPLPSDAIIAWVAINQQPGLNPPKKDSINPANLVGEVVSPEQ